MHSELPSFKCQARPDLMKGIVCRIVFQTIEMTDLGQTGRRIQSKICYNQMYLWYVIVVQRFCVVRSVQLILAARASAKTDDPLVPIPPIFFGREIFFQLTQENVFLSFCLFHRYLQHICWIWAIIPRGIQSSDIQYIGVASSIYFISTKRPALDRNLWFQIFSLFSLLITNQI